MIPLGQPPTADSGQLPSDPPVTMLELNQFEEFFKQEQAATEAILEEANRRADEYKDTLAQAGALLVANPSAWDSKAAAEFVDAALKAKDQAVSAAAELDLKQKKRQGIVGGLFAKLTGKSDIEKAEARSLETRDALNVAMGELARHAKDATLPAATALTEHALAISPDVEELHAKSSSAAARFQALSDEIIRRRQAVDTFGFDSEFLAANLAAGKADKVESPLLLKAGEQAFLSVPATLARHRSRTTFVGSSQGVSIPVGHGVRFRTSGFAGHPVVKDEVVEVDRGTLVLTSQRIAFVGEAKSISFPLTKLVNLHEYSNGLGMGREGKESPEIFLFEQPHRAVVYLDWLLAR